MKPQKSIFQTEQAPKPDSTHQFLMLVGLSSSSIAPTRLKVLVGASCLLTQAAQASAVAIAVELSERPLPIVGTHASVEQNSIETTIQHSTSNG
jgi:hypothetical protein